MVFIFIMKYFDLRSGPSCCFYPLFIYLRGFIWWGIFQIHKHYILLFLYFKFFYTFFIVFASFLSKMPWYCCFFICNLEKIIIMDLAWYCIKFHFIQSKKERSKLVSLFLCLLIEPCFYILNQSHHMGLIIKCLSDLLISVFPVYLKLISDVLWLVAYKCFNRFSLVFLNFDKLINSKCRCFDLDDLAVCKFLFNCQSVLRICDNISCWSVVGFVPDLYFWLVYYDFIVLHGI